LPRNDLAGLIYAPVGRANWLTLNKHSITRRPFSRRAGPARIPDGLPGEVAGRC